MNTQHTPAPWSISPPCELSPRYSVYHNGPLVYVDRAEDARLIAAAPDLLDALRAILTDASEDIAGLPHDEALDLLSAIAGTAREAIAKATGGAA